MEPKDRQTPPDARAQHRAYVLEYVVNGGLTIGQATVILKLSTSQVDRLLARSGDGPAALAHGNRGRTPANRIDDQLRRGVVELATTSYAGVNHTHLAELLAEREGLVVAGRSLRRILAEASVRPTRTRRPPRHRSRRERMPREGQLLEVDGSKHRWFGPDHPLATVVGAIDDATSRVRRRGSSCSSPNRAWRSSAVPSLPRAVESLVSYSLYSFRKPGPGTGALRRGRHDGGRLRTVEESIWKCGPADKAGC